MDVKALVLGMLSFLDTMDLKGQDLKKYPIGQTPQQLFYDTYLPVPVFFFFCFVLFFCFFFLFCFLLLLLFFVLFFQKCRSVKFSKNYLLIYVGLLFLQCRRVKRSENYLRRN